jgi:hypothetical protein
VTLSSSIVSSRSSGHRPVLRGLFLFLSSLLVFAFCGPHTAQGAVQATASAAPTRSGVPFAFADFDGDHRPDFATVEATAGRTASTENYWIRLRLSSLGKSYVHLSAPKGGLLVEARDVNGDNAIDLVLATAWLDRPVGILLNDGRGNFSQANPVSFPGAFYKSSAVWNSSVIADFYPFALTRASSSIENSLAASAERLLANKEFLRFQNAISRSLWAIARYAGRAPPSAILL